MALAVLGLVTAAHAAPADSVVAAVGDELILASELDQAVNFLRLSQPDSLVPDRALEELALGRLIDNLVLEEQARRESVEVAASEVAAEVDASIATVKERFGDEEQYKAALASEG